MATVPTQLQVESAIEETATLISQKASEQESEGKDFILPSGGGPGVIPEDAWKTHKETV